MGIVIFGAGDFGKRLFHFLCMLEVKVDLFLQSKVPVINNCEGIEIISFEQYVKMNRTDYIFIALNNQKTVYEITHKLMDNGIDAKRIFDLSSFIDENLHKEDVRIGNKYCNLCGRLFDRFKPSGLKDSIFERLKIIGGGYRNDAVCPYCGSFDRTRWVFYVLKKFTDIFEMECTVVHFAPEKQLRNAIEVFSNCNYYPGDICRQNGINKIDVTDIPFVDEFADYVIINHVLEHVKDEKKAIYEMKRVLKKNGKIVMTFPISLVQGTFEDDAIVSEDAREKYYGQKDHVRLYGNDFKERFENYGLKVKCYSPKDYLTKDDIERFGLIPDDIVLICSK